ncbi:hypothetical protein Golomagni_02436 [Golovinomyces magnicellulatus]|nr:hypothetical protein Golomagni_02436 [Golovinomyces magnicellulatus]
MPVPVASNMSGPSIFDKFKMGAMMGSSEHKKPSNKCFPWVLSLASYLASFLDTLWILWLTLKGSVNIIRFGAGSNGIMRTLGNYMLGSGATFGFFMSIGSMVRTDTISQSALEAFARSQRRAIILPRINTSPPNSRC